MMKVRVTTHSGDDEIYKVESIDLEEITEQRNDDDIQAIQISNASFAKIDIKNIYILEDD